MTENDKEKLIKKWSALGFGEGIQIGGSGASTPVIGELDHPSTFPSLLPIAMKVAAKTIAMDLVSVSPMDPPGFIFKPAIERLKHRWERLKKLQEEGSTEISYARERVVEEMRAAFEGISDERIDEHINNPEMMESLLKIGEASERFGV